MNYTTRPTAPHDLEPTLEFERVIVTDPFLVLITGPVGGGKSTTAKRHASTIGIAVGGNFQAELVSTCDGRPPRRGHLRLEGPKAFILREINQMAVTSNREFARIEV